MVKDWQKNYLEALIWAKEGRAMIRFNKIIEKVAKILSFFQRRVYKTFICSFLDFPSFITEFKSSSVADYNGGRSIVATHKVSQI